jgi:hypothetical protein
MKYATEMGSGAMEFGMHIMAPKPAFLVLKK